MKRVVLAALLTSLPALAVEQVDLTQDEWKMYRHYQRAMADPQVERIAPAKRLGAIAKDAGFKPTELKRAVQRGEAAGDVKAKCEQNLRELLGSTPVSSRLGRLEVDTESPHALAYVEWRNEAPDQLEEEASLVAAKTAEACPLLSSIQVWAQDAANPKQRVFQALITRSAAEKINASRVKEYADTRFIRLFERVTNAATGAGEETGALP